MARYIDADNFRKTMIKRFGCIPCLTDYSEASRYDIPLDDALNLAPTADVVPKSEEGAECPTCYGTGRIGTTNWLTKNMTKKQIAEEKARAIAEHEQYIKTEYAKEIFEEIENIHEECIHIDHSTNIGYLLQSKFEHKLTELKKKYTENENG